MLGLLRPAVIVHPVAIGTAEGERTLSYTRLHLGRGSLNPLVEAQMQQERLPVERVTVDVSDARQIFDSIGQIRLVKIDVEGLEHEVLEALLPALSRGQIDYLDLELDSNLAGAWWPRLEELLRELRRSLQASFSSLSDQGELVPRSLESALQGAALSHLIVSFVDRKKGDYERRSKRSGLVTNTTPIP
jgi:FkbM family methyltransferase